jgi:phage FluMu protein Com
MRVAENFGGVWLVSGQILRTLKLCVCCAPVLGELHEVQTLDAHCPTCRKVCQTVLATLLEHGGWRDRHLRACVLACVAFGSRLGFV